MDQKYLTAIVQDKIKLQGWNGYDVIMRKNIGLINNGLAMDGYITTTIVTTIAEF